MSWKGKLFIVVVMLAQIWDIRRTSNKIKEAKQKEEDERRARKEKAGREQARNHEKELDELQARVTDLKVRPRWPVLLPTNQFRRRVPQ
jgi:beta-phosphoglucomutase-like phosphatase (HAD superfamily)